MKHRILLLLLLSFNIANAQFIQTSGPVGSSIYAIADNDSTIFAAGDWGIYRSTNEGETWHAVHAGAWMCTGLAVDGDIVLAEDYQGVLYRSTNRGLDWEVISRVFQQNFSYAVHLFQYQHAFFLGNSQGFFRSMDSGTTWNQIDIGEQAAFTSMAANTEYLFAGSSVGVFRSSDGGTTWIATPDTLTRNTYALAANGSTITTGTAMSTDNGDTWASTSGLPSELTGALHSITATNATFIAATYYGVFRSSDGGLTWNASSEGLSGANVRTLAVAGERIFAGTDGGSIQRSTNAGLSWSAAGAGIIESQVSSMIADNGHLFAATAMGTYRTDDQGDSWNKSGPGNLVRGIAAQNGYIIASILDSGLYRSSDNGATWMRLDTITFETLLATTDRIVGATRDGFHRSTDDGATWEFSPVPGDALPTSLAASSTALYAGRSDYQNNSYVGGLQRSTDGGETWEWIYDKPIRKVAANDEYVWCTGFTFFDHSTTPFFKRSTDGGVTWSNVTVVPGADSITKAISALQYMNGMLYVGSLGRVFVSEDNGDTWHEMTNRKIAALIFSFALDGEYLYAGTTSGVWRRSLTQLDVPDMASAHSIMLSSISPNPGSTTTTISYTVNQSSHLRLTIRDILGHTVATLVDGTVERGDHSISFDMSTLPAGSYYCIMETGDHIAVQPVIVAK